MTDDRHVPRYSSVAKRYASVNGDRYEIDVQLAWGYERVIALLQAIVKRAILCPGMDVVACSGLVRFEVKRLGSDAEFACDPSDTENESEGEQ